MHSAAVGGVFVLLARRLPPWAALVGVVPLLVLGSGYENLLWAFQIGFVGSVAAGTWGLVALETDHRRWTAVLGSGTRRPIALASSGMGLFFAPRRAVRSRDPAFRRRVIWPHPGRRIRWLVRHVRTAGAVGSPRDAGDAALSRSGPRLCRVEDRGVRPRGPRPTVAVVSSRS